MGSWDLQVPELFTLKYPPSWLTTCRDKQSFAVRPVAPQQPKEWRVGGGGREQRKSKM